MNSSNNLYEAKKCLEYYISLKNYDRTTCELSRGCTTSPNYFLKVIEYPTDTSDSLDTLRNTKIINHKYIVDTAEHLLPEHQHWLIFLQPNCIDLINQEFTCPIYSYDINMLVMFVIGTLYLIFTK